MVGCIGGGTASRYGISGSVKDDDGNGISDVEIVIKRALGKTQTVITDEYGHWYASGLRGTMRVTPKKLGWNFKPSTLKVSKQNTAVNFTAKFTEPNTLWSSIIVKHNFPNSIVEQDTKLFSFSSLVQNLHKPKTSQRTSFKSDILDEQIVTFDSSIDIASQKHILEQAGYEVLDTIECLNAHLVVESKVRLLRQTHNTLDGVFSIENNVARYPINYMNTPNDQYFSHQWHYSQIRLPQAWNITTGDRSIRIAVIDSGIDPTHPDLIDNINFADARDFTNSNSSANIEEQIKDLIGHGTHVAGTIGAMSNNAQGVAGVMWDVEIIPLKIFDSEDSTSDGWSIVKALLYAVGLENPVDIINMSFGGGAFDFEKIVIDKAHSKGIIMVAAAGNDGTPNVFYPAAYPEVIAVGATDFGTAGGNYVPQLASYSNWGPQIDVVAPGGSVLGEEHILSTLPVTAKGSYGYMIGTSMAAPHVTGVIGLMLANGINKSEVRDILRRTSMEIDGRGFNSQVGHGLINAYWAVNGVERMRIIQGIREGNGISVIATEDSISPKGGESTLSLVGGDYQFIAWVDVNDNDVIDAGDYYAESGTISVKEEQSYTFIAEVEEVSEDLEVLLGLDVEGKPLGNVQVEQLY